MGDVANESMCDYEDNKKTMMKIQKTISEFREAYMRKKLKD